MATSRTNQRRRRQMLTGSTALFAGLVMTSSVPTVGALPSIVPMQAEPETAEVALPAVAVGDALGAHPSLSSDGRWVVYQGAPVDPADARLLTVYLTDRESGIMTELTPVPASIRAGDSVLPQISGDGCSVVTLTQMPLDVFRDDDKGERWDVYRAQLPQCGGSIGNWDLVSSRVGSGGVARDDVVVAAPTVSRSGTRIAYTHPADHLFDAAGITTISLVDTTVPIDGVGRTRFVEGSPADSPTDTYVHAGLDQPVLSGNGEYLAYRSDATSSEGVPGWAPGVTDGGPATTQVYSWQIAESDPFRAVRLTSVRPDGTPSSGAGEPDISRSGLDLAFSSSDTSLADAAYPNCTDRCPGQVFAARLDSDRDGVIGEDEAPRLTLVSARQDGDGLVAGGSPSSQPSMSGDGQLVAFVTKATDLQLIEVPGVGSDDDGDLLLAEIRTGRLTRLTNGVGTILPTPGVHAHPDLSDAGRTVVFDTAAAADLLAEGALAGRQVVARTADPQLSLPDADLGTTLVGLESDEWYLAVINDGPSSFIPASVTISNPQFTINRDKSTCMLASSTVPAGGSCEVALTYTPIAPGGATATLTVAEEGYGAVSISAQVAGAGGNPALRIEPAGISFGTVVVGEPSIEKQFDLGNIAFTPTEITEFEISGVHAADFTFTANNCAFRALNPRATCSIGITFTPSDAGRRTALVELTTRDGQYTTMVVDGDGAYEPTVSIDLTTVEVGDMFLATGTQYPPNTEVTVVFGDGPTSSVTATTDAEGNFSVEVPVSANERGGQRRVVVQTAAGAAATAPLEVVEDDQLQIGLPGFGLG